MLSSRLRELALGDEVLKPRVTETKQRRKRKPPTVDSGLNVDAGESFKFFRSAANDSLTIFEAWYERTNITVRRAVNQLLCFPEAKREVRSSYCGGFEFVFDGAAVLQ
jgi:hypothetical protein